MQIHSTAIVHPEAKLGSNVAVGPYSIIEAGASIGDDSSIGPHCVIGAGTQLGRGNQSFSGAQIGVAPQDLKHLPGVAGKTVIGDNNTFREFVTVSSSTVYQDDPEEKVTRIGDGCLFMASSHVAHDCIVGNGVIMANSAALAGHVTVQDMVILGGLVGIHQFCVLGSMSFIGGMSRINKDVLPYMIVEGNPARCHGPNTIGLQRNGLDADQIKRIRMIYKHLYRSGLNTTQALEKIEAEVEASEERRTLVDFVRNSERGVTR